MKTVLLLSAVLLSQGRMDVDRTVRINSDELAQVSDVEEHDGVVYVVDPQLSQILTFDLLGSARGTVGREGQGPAEFVSPGKLGWVGDTLWIQDRGNGRIVLIDGGRGAGTLNSALPLEHPDPLVNYLEITSLVAGANALAIVNPSLDVLADGVLDEVPYYLTDRSGGQRDHLFELDVRHSVLGANSDGSSFRISGGLFFPQPFAPNPVVDVAPNGEAIIRVDRATYRVVKLSSSGDVVFDKVIPFDRRPIETETLDAAVDNLSAPVEPYAERLRFASARALRRAIRDAVYVPEHLPPVVAIVAGGDGALWVRRADAAADIVRWDVLDSAGDLIGHVRLPSQFTGYGADIRGIWGVTPDENDVPVVERYEIR